MLAASSTVDNHEQPFDHELVHILKGPRSGLTVIIAVHDTTLGPALGGCRVWNYPDWTDALADALRLSNGMTSKNALAGLRAGGGKSVIHLPPGDTLTGGHRRDAFLDLGDAVEEIDGRYRTAEDVGTTSLDMAVVAEMTRHVVGLPAEQGGKGDPAAYTARGVYSALVRTVQRSTGSRNLAGRRITVVGLGQVGSRLAKRFAEEGAILTVADLDQTKREFTDALGATWIEPERAHLVPSDVFVPAGVGGMLTARVIEEIETTAIVGPANNQLTATAGATRLAERGILYAPDYLVNAGGVVYLGGDETEVDTLARIDAIGETLGFVFDEAERSGITTLEAADRMVHTRLSR